MNNDTQKKFAAILAAAKAKATTKAVLKSATPIEPVKPAISMPELSTVTIEQILNESPATEPNNSLTLIDYSEKAFAVIGETKPIKEQLKKLGGKFNMYLSCGPGWIFSKKQFDNVKKALAL